MHGISALIRSVRDIANMQLLNKKHYFKSIQGYKISGIITYNTWWIAFINVVSHINKKSHHNVTAFILLPLPRTNGTTL